MERSRRRSRSIRYRTRCTAIADFGVSATASSGLPVSFAAAGNCTVSGSTIHLTGAGSCTVTASQSGDATYAPATPMSRSFAIGKAGQTITFGPLADKTFGDPDFTVSATASSGLAVSFAATRPVHGLGKHCPPDCVGLVHDHGFAGRQHELQRRRRPSPGRSPINPGQPNTGTPLSLSSTIEGHLDFSTGAWANGGFHVKLSQSNASPVTVTVTGNVNLPCTAWMGRALR